MTTEEKMLNAIISIMLENFDELFKAKGDLFELDSHSEALFDVNDMSPEMKNHLDAMVILQRFFQVVTSNNGKYEGMTDEESEVLTDVITSYLTKCAGILQDIKAGRTKFISEKIQKSKELVFEFYQTLKDKE